MKRLLLIDGNAILHRAYHAAPPALSPPRHTLLYNHAPKQLLTSSSSYDLKIESLKIILPDLSIAVPIAQSASSPFSFPASNFRPSLKIPNQKKSPLFLSCF